MTNIGREIGAKQGLPLLPKRFKTAGWLLLIPGGILSAVRFFFGIKIRELDFKVFAFYSSFFESKYFTFIQNNYTEEAAGALLMLGLIFIAFSKEEVEDDNVMQFRLRSLFMASYIFLSLVLLTILFVFGFAFINLLITEVFIMPAAYIIIFKSYYHKYLIKSRIKKSAVSEQIKIGS